MTAVVNQKLIYHMLRILMTLCSLGEEWKEDPSKIPVNEIAEEWRSQGKRGRYEAAMWRAAGLEEKARRALAALVAPGAVVAPQVTPGAVTAA